MQHHPVTTLIQTQKNSPRPHHSAGLRNAHVGTVSLQPCGEHHSHISRVVHSPRPVTSSELKREREWRRRSYVMACRDRATPCTYCSPTFLRHKPSDSVYFFQSKIYPKFDRNRMHLLCLASFSDGCPYSKAW